MALLATVQRSKSNRLPEALEQTFGYRDTHRLPAMLPAPPSTWSVPYAAIAREDQLTWRTLEQVTTATQQFLNPVLAGVLNVEWHPAAWRWRRG
jgi:hypothetical protein